MKLSKPIMTFLLTVFLSLFVFPIGFKFLPPSLNTKMILGAMGIFAYMFNGIRSQSVKMHRTTVVAMLITLVFSLWCFFSMVFNETPDDSYATYFMSFAVWLGGAYAVIALIREYHGYCDLALLTKYLTWLCIAQCVLALVIDSVPAFDAFLDRFIEQGQEFMRRKRRLYGIGAALDTAGVRFSVTLILIAHQIVTNSRILDKKSSLYGYLFAFFLITMIGNMIARTTLVGVALGLGYIFLFLGVSNRGVFNPRKMRFYRAFFVLVTVAVVVSVIFYNISPEFRANIRFAFEAFFNLFENGEFRTDSTDKLNDTMWIWPDTLRGWILGNGWFGFFIYATDIGYCRFVLYCGLVGLFIFSFFFIFNAAVVGRRFEKFGFAAFLLMVTTFVIWLKVATDIFFIYALLYCIDQRDFVPELEDGEKEPELE